MKKGASGGASRRRVSPEDVIVAAFKLFSEKGFAGTTVQEIATEAGIAPRTVFRYFPTKADIPIARIRQHLDLLRKRVRSWPPAQSLREAVRAIAQDHATYLEKKAVWKLAPEFITHPAITRRWLELLQVEYPALLAQDFAHREGRSEPTLEHRVAARLLMMVLDEGSKERVQKGERPLDQEIAALLRLLRRLL